MLLESICCGRCGENGSREAGKVSAMFLILVLVFLRSCHECGHGAGCGNTGSAVAHSSFLFSVVDEPRTLYMLGTTLYSGFSLLTLESSTSP